MIKVGLIGDFDESVPAHRAIPVALGLAAESLGAPVDVEWIPTNAIESEDPLLGYHGLWCVPASPYRSMDGAIRYAREQRRPFRVSTRGCRIRSKRPRMAGCRAW